MQVAMGPASITLALMDALTVLPRKVLEHWYLSSIWMALHLFAAYATLARSTAVATKTLNERS
jgi:hypothetical protein